MPGENQTTGIGCGDQHEHTAGWERAAKTGSAGRREAAVCERGSKQSKRKCQQENWAPGELFAVSLHLHKLSCSLL